MIVVGVDVWKRGWVAVVLVDGAVAAVETHEAIVEVIDGHPDAVAIGVDIPIGLPAAPPRIADLQAAAVGPRRASVFPTPPREVLGAATYAEARALARDRYGMGLSAQSYALRRRVLEVDAVAGDEPRLFEVHPEVSFRALAGEPLAWPKRTWNGQMQRRRLLACANLVIPDHLDRAGAVPPDDVLDAAVVAWSAARIAARTAGSLPEDATPSGRGAIWY